MTAPGGRDLGFRAGDTMRAVQQSLVGAFRAGGIVSAEADARLLLRAATGADASPLLGDPERIVASGEAQALSASARRRLAFEPVSRILGERAFYGRDFAITPDVLDPRPETETLVDAVLEIVRGGGLSDRPIRIADIGTGSGALIVTLLAELKGATGIATDVSAAALDVAKANARRHGVGARATFIHTRNLQGVAGAFDIVVANPPYIASGEIAHLERDVRDYDPHVALDGGPDGMAIYREISSEVRGLEKPLWIVVEVGVGQAESVVEIFVKSAAGSPPPTQKSFLDLAGQRRCVALQLHSR